MYHVIFVIAACVASFNGVVCDNTTSSYRSANFQTRQHRLFTFNTEDEDHIKVELDFNVPFISIPIKPTLDIAHGAFANINIGAVVMAGMMALGTASIVPISYQLISKQLLSFAGTQLFGSGNKYRSESETSGMWRLMASVDQALANNNIDSTSCVQRAICWTVKNSNSNISAGQGASSSDKIIDGLATNEWIKYMVEGSVFQAAIDSGLKGDNCDEEYSQCKINQKNIKMFSKQFINAIYNRK